MQMTRRGTRPGCARAPEGDLIIGKNRQSAIGTLVERSTRYCLLLHLPDGRSAEHVRDAMITTIGALPEHLCRVPDLGPRNTNGVFATTA
ncbi:MAG: transposase, family [Actinomycetota bacterium]|jgi:IS30 family transposase|nr:transposase, family [Actinomycetota bacterium]